MSIGKRLAELRKSKGLTQSELGQMLNITAQAISKWENEGSEPDIDTIRKLAEIYGVSVSDIIDPDGVRADERVEGAAVVAAPEREVADPNLCDVYLTAIGESKITTINYIMKMLGIGLAEAKRGVEDLPYLISGGLTKEMGERIVAYLAEVGAVATIEVAKVGTPKREILTTTTPEPPKEDHTMRKRFITANLTAGIPAIIAMVLNYIYIFKAPIDVLPITYIGISIYSLIFLLWYPTLTRKLFSPVITILWGAEGFFKTIGAIILVMLMFPWIIIVGLLAPINYAFAIKTRVRRMIDEDWDDDIFE